MKYLLQRLIEPSSHAGLAAIAVALGTFFPQYKAVADALVALFGSLAVVISEKQAS